jgi:hypothetical protein
MFNAIFLLNYSKQVNYRSVILISQRKCKVLGSMILDPADSD